MKTITLRAERERSLLRRHPWVFEGSVAKGRADSGETVRVESSEGRFLAWGAYCAESTLRVRVWSFDEHERIDAAFFSRRVKQAVALRARLAIDSNALRLVHGEADGLPGLVVDRYADTLCAQFGSAGVERHKGLLADALCAATGCTRLYERSDASARAQEGLPEATGWLRGSGPTVVPMHEHGWRMQVDVAQGHKTGHYLDQRDNRALFAKLVRQFGCTEVLNTYCYTGGFTLAALAGGAKQVTSVDSSAPALAAARAHVAGNGFDAAAHEFLDADVNKTLRAMLAAGRSFDAIVLDPPKFAPNAASAERASRAYKDINRLALQALRPGGLLFTFSCSGGISPDLFHKIVAGAAMDAEVDGAILHRLEAACDHPSTLLFPEGAYLKGLVILKAPATPTALPG